MPSFAAPKLPFQFFHWTFLPQGSPPSPAWLWVRSLSPVSSHKPPTSPITFTLLCNNLVVCLSLVLDWEHVKAALRHLPCPPLSSQGVASLWHTVMHRKYLLNKWALGQYDNKSSGSSRICICLAHFKVSARGDRKTGPELERPAAVGLPWPPFPVPSSIPSFPRSRSGILVSSGPRRSSLSVDVLASVCVRFRSLFYILINLKIRLTIQYNYFQVI